MAGNRISKAKYYIGITFLAVIIGYVIILAGRPILGVSISEYSKYLMAIIVGVSVFAIFRIMVRLLEHYLKKAGMSDGRIKPIVLIISMVAYFMILIAVLSTLGIDVSSLILSSALISVVLGLAAQSVLANQFAGILIIATKPFKIGDRIIIQAWQWGATFPTIPPKYISTDFFINSSVSGIVTNLTINYTVVMMDSGDIVRVPNGVLVQAAFFIRKGNVVVQARTEIPKNSDLEYFKKNVAEEIRKFPEVIEEPTILVDEMTMTSMFISIKAKFKGEEAAERRSRMLEVAMKYTKPKEGA